MLEFPITFATAIRTRNNVLKTLSILADEVKFVDESVVIFGSHDTFEGKDSILVLAAKKETGLISFPSNYWEFKPQKPGKA